MELKSTKYRLVHYWVEREKGKPQKCEQCGTTNSKRFHWANTDHKYTRDLTKWKRLCVRCHRLRENIIYCKRGHFRQGNTYIKPDGRMECSICAQEYKRRYYLKKKAK